ncbi:FeoA family protein [Magnetococcus marinus MC-1]|uniref:FeoA family protein n=1 Tax=Magnetococcus marinus (strain ATCC BAA-1437 / JCM 17883 / MC-1) TaxID=156889 RepID=A0L9P7_MAGMM|nr:FeoA family protein [Magnetococcus marinus]ABK44690.1 FeoA family protein [Magnetococcus marinus MC-1]
MTLLELKKGHIARISGVHGSAEERNRFTSMGLIPGKQVMLRNQAPFGDPRIYVIMGYELSLRNKDAEKIKVEPLELTPPNP